jgi:hypothetical protein
LAQGRFGAENSYGETDQYEVVKITHFEPLLYAALFNELNHRSDPKINRILVGAGAVTSSAQFTP